MACVLVDIDGTLIVGTSSERLFIGYLARNGVLGPQQYAAAIRFPLRWAGEYGWQVFKKNKAYLAGLESGAVETLSVAFVQEALEPRLRETMLRRLKVHRDAGDSVALLSGSPEFIARPLARSLGIHDWSATRFALDGDRYAEAPPICHPFGGEKLARADELCERLGFELSDCVAYADSVYDLPLLRGVKRPIAVCPDRLLARAARRDGWEILPA